MCARGRLGAPQRAEPRVHESWPPHTDVANRVPITVGLMLATVMNSLDTTIANVALPHMQGSVSASQDQITWVLTSYIVAAAIMTPLSGWLADRFGRKRMFLISIAGFTVASMLCGIATSLAEIVLFRLLQGVFGAALIPLSQAVLLDINPPEQHRPGHGDLGRRRDPGADPRPGARRLADRQLLLALGASSSTCRSASWPSSASGSSCRGDTRRDGAAVRLPRLRRAGRVHRRRSS